MRRRSWLTGMCLSVAVVAAALIANTVAPASAAPIPTVCPTKQPGTPGNPGVVTSRSKLIPFTPAHALLCRYNGMNASALSPAWDLAGTARLDGSKAAQLASATNRAAHVPGPGAVNCPMDDASHLDVYFWTSSHRIRVRYLTSGCVSATNGGPITFSLSKGDVVSELEQLTSRDGRDTLRGSIHQFGGPMAAGVTPPTLQ